MRYAVPSKDVLLMLRNYMLLMIMLDNIILTHTEKIKMAKHYLTFPIKSNKLNTAMRRIGIQVPM